MNPMYWNQDPYTEKTFSKPFVPHSLYDKIREFLVSDGMVQYHLVSKLRALVVHSILPECSQNSLTGLSKGGKSLDLPKIYF